MRVSIHTGKSVNVQWSEMLFKVMNRPISDAHQGLICNLNNALFFA